MQKNHAPNVLTETSDKDWDDNHGLPGDKDDDVHAEFDPPRAEPSSSSFPVDKPLSKQAWVEEVKDEDLSSVGK